jgi:hypothetical protein
LSADGQSWVDPKHPQFLVPVRALSILFRAKFCDGLKKAGLLRFVPSAVCKLGWVVHSQHAGRGDKVLDYLGRYLFRIAISNSRLESLDHSIVRFRYRDNKTQQICHVSLPATEFIHRFLQHVLPKGLTKVRNYGIFSPACRSRLDWARQRFAPTPAVPVPSRTVAPEGASALQELPSLPAQSPCPRCKTGSLFLLETLPSRRNHSP